MRKIGTVTGRLSSSKPNMQNYPKPSKRWYMHGFKTGDRVEMTVFEADVEVRRRGTVTYARKLRRIGVKFDSGETAQVRVRQVRKLDELEILGEALGSDQ